MATYKELLEQREELEKQIQAARVSELAEAIAKVRGIISEFDLSPEDVFAPARRTRSTAGVTVSPKYRHPDSGATWTGRGKAPRWIADATDREIYAIKPEQ